MGKKKDRVDRLTVVFAHILDRMMPLGDLKEAVYQVDEPFQDTDMILEGVAKGLAQYVLDEE